MKRKINTNMITRIALSAVFIALGAWLAIPTQPPVTLQTVCIFVISVMLKPLDAFITVLLYLLLGISGVPVFSSFSGGIGILLSVSGGFLISFLIIAPLVSFLTRKFRTSIFTHAFTFTVATLVSYIIGALWIDIMGYYDGSFWKMVSACILPFLVFDPFKIALTVFCTLKLKRIFNNEKKKN